MLTDKEIEGALKMWHEMLPTLENNEEKECVEYIIGAVENRIKTDSELERFKKKNIELTLKYKKLEKEIDNVKRNVDMARKECKKDIDIARKECVKDEADGTIGDFIYSCIKAILCFIGIATILTWISSLI